MAISLPCFKALCGCPLLAAPNPSTVSWAVWTYTDQSPTPTPAGPPFFLEGPGSSHFHPFAHAVLSTQGTLPPPAHLDYTSTFNTDITSSRKASCLDASRQVGAAHGIPQLPVPAQHPPPHWLVTQLSLPFLRGSAGLAAAAWGWGPGRGGRKWGEHRHDIV